MSFLEMLDVVNEDLIARGEEPIAFDSRLPRRHLRHVLAASSAAFPTAATKAPLPASFTCGSFKDGDTITVEPWRAKAFPHHQGPDHQPQRLRPHHPGGRLCFREHRRRPDGNALPVPKTAADRAMDAAACIGCGACVAVCKNASAMLFVAAKVSHLNLLPQGKAEKDRRVLNMVKQMDKEGFGNCTVTGSCEAVCPKEISLSFIAKMNRDYQRNQNQKKATEKNASRGGSNKARVDDHGCQPNYDGLQEVEPHRHR
jgi:succinate dehydrogenase / fumarate reductase iron-sulfur subunit